MIVCAYNCSIQETDARGSQVEGLPSKILSKNQKGEKKKKEYKSAIHYIIIYCVTQEGGLYFKIVSNSYQL